MSTDVVRQPGFVIKGNQIENRVPKPLVFNEAGVDIDFRIEGDTEENLFFIDASTDRIGIGTSSPHSGLHYQGDILYLTPAAGAESNDNITIKNYATSTGAPDIILRTADIGGAYGISVGALSLIGGSKTTHYGVGGEISLQGGQGRDAANNPSSYAPVLLQPNAGNVGIGTLIPKKDLHIESGVPTLRMSDDNAATDQAVATLVEFYRGNNTNRVGFFGMESSSNDVMKLATDYAAGEIAFSTGSSSEAMRIDSTGNVGVGIAVPAAKLHIDQATADAAVPVLYLDQADVSEEIIEIVSAAGIGNAVELVNSKSLTVTEFIKVTINGNTRYIPAGTIA